MPDREEQQLIGSFFKNISAKIDNQSKYISKLQSLKQAYLSELFV